MPADARKNTVEKPRNTSGLRRGGGRPKGVPNKATREVRAFCRGLLEDPEYVRRFTRRLLRGTLPPRLEELVWLYAYGKPKEPAHASALDDLAAALARHYHTDDEGTE